MTMRYIKMGYEDRDGEKRMIVIVTDLLDPEKYPMEEIADLYIKRWQIEVKFRDVKTTMQMEQFDVKTPELAKLTLQMVCIAYNLIRSIMQRASIEADKPVHEMSFQAIRYTIINQQENFLETRGKPLLRRKLYEKVMSICAEHVLNIRPFRIEPRAKKLRPKSYPLLQESRRSFRERVHPPVSLVS